MHDIRLHRLVNLIYSRQYRLPLVIILTTVHVIRPCSCSTKTKNRENGEMQGIQYLVVVVFFFLLVLFFILNRDFNVLCTGL